MTRATVLVVDDEADMLDVMVAFLRGEHRVLGALDVAGALAVLAREPCDVVVTDIHMPGVSGADLVRELARTRPAVPIVVVSGYERIEGLPVRRWLAKPFRRVELVAAVGDALASRQLEGGGASRSRSIKAP